MRRHVENFNSNIVMLYPKKKKKKRKEKNDEMHITSTKLVYIKANTSFCDGLSFCQVTPPSKINSLQSSNSLIN